MTKQPTTDRYLNKAEVATYLGLSVRMIDKLDAAKEGGTGFPRSTKIVGRKRWLQSEIARWAKNGG